MSTSSARTPKIVQLASRLEQDIQTKKLLPGDPYLSTLEAARMLGVSTVASNRALQLLVKRDVLRRRQKSGTFIAHPNVQSQPPAIDRVHLLVHQNYLKSEGLLADGVILGIQGVLPKVDIQFNFLPPSEEGVYVNGLISEVLSSSRTEGFVMVRAPLEVQRIVQASGLPAVIHGTPIPSIAAVPWIDRDHFQAGRLAAERLISHGFRNLTIITRERLMPGDYVMFDGVREVMSAAQLSIESIGWRPLPSDSEVAKCAVLDLLRGNTKPQGFICRSRPLADGAAEAIASAGMTLGKEAGVVVLDVYQTSARSAPRLPYLMPILSSETIGQHIGQMLSLQASGRKPHPDHEIIPVELIEPVAV